MDHLGASKLSRPFSRPYSSAMMLHTSRPSSTVEPKPRSFFEHINVNPIWQYNPFIYRMSEISTTETLGIILQDVCNARGWKRFGPDEENTVGGNRMNWNLWWRFTPNPVHSGRSLHCWQFTNHIPKAVGFCNKQYLATYSKQMIYEHGSIYDFVPKTFVLPKEYVAFVTEHQARAKLEFSNHENPAERAQNLVPTTKGQTSGFSPIWIIKPVGKSQGKGIMVVDNAGELEVITAKDKENNYILPTFVAQEYITRPLLIAGFKFDLRLYVCVASVNPLTVYMYREGLTRFATEKYDVDDLTNYFSHLTNSSVNKTGPGYGRDKEGVGIGCKWSLAQLRAHFREIGYADRYLWQRIASMVVLSLIGESEKWLALPYTRNCFTFLGYDILIDEHLRPWLLEVNLCPGLNADCTVDYEVKRPMLNELFDLIGLPNAKESSQVPATAKSRKAVTRSPVHIPKYLPTPLPLMNPEQVHKAMKLIRPKNREKFERNPILMNRLANLASVYSKPLIPDSMRPKATNFRLPSSKCAPKLPKSAKTVSFPQKKKANTSEKVTKEQPEPHNGMTFRNWTNPIKKCGNWIRVFPFDSASHEMSRYTRYQPLDAARLVQRVQHNLTNARLLEYEYSKTNVNYSDANYKQYLQEINQLSTEVWMPPRANKKAQNPTPVTSPRETVTCSGDPAEEIHVISDPYSLPTIFTLDSAVSLASNLIDELLPSEPKPVTESGRNLPENEESEEYFDSTDDDGETQSKEFDYSYQESDTDDGNNNNAVFTMEESGWMEPKSSGTAPKSASSSSCNSSKSDRPVSAQKSVQTGAEATTDTEELVTVHLGVQPFAVSSFSSNVDLVTSLHHPPQSLPSPSPRLDDPLAEKIVTAVKSSKSRSHPTPSSSTSTSAAVRTFTPTHLLDLPILGSGSVSEHETNYNEAEHSIEQGNEIGQTDSAQSLPPLIDFDSPPEDEPEPHPDVADDHDPGLEGFEWSPESSPKGRRASTSTTTAEEDEDDGFENYNMDDPRWYL